MSRNSETQRLSSEAEEFRMPQGPDGESETQPGSQNSPSPNQVDRLVDSQAERRQWAADQQARHDRYSDKWKRRTHALSSIRLTGDLVVDAAAFFQAAEIHPRQIHSDYDLDTENGLSRYFRDVEHATIKSPENGEAMQAYYDALGAAAKAVRVAHEEKEHKSALSASLSDI
jgi:hypothetical protein